MATQYIHIDIDTQYIQKEYTNRIITGWTEQ